MSKEPKYKPDEPCEESKDTLNSSIEFQRILMDVAKETAPIIQEFWEKQSKNSFFDPLHMSDAWSLYMQALIDNPNKLAELQFSYWKSWMTLWQESAHKFSGESIKERYQPEKGDKRFNSPLWDENALFSFIKQSYLMTAHFMHEAIQENEDIDIKTKEKLDFGAKQFLNAIAPTNFLLTNPEVIQETIDSKGENLVKGMKNLLEDLKRGKGHLRISTVDNTAFEVGKNLAVTPGKVVFQNDLMQLIQYECPQKKTFKRPLLIVPPWINKYYILDMQPHNSFIKWLTEQGHTVFTISWVNPDKERAQKRFEDYMSEGVLAALEQVLATTGEKDCNLISYCLGGTLLATTLAYMEKTRQAHKIASATFLTTLIDFEKAGDMKLFMDDAGIKTLEKTMEEHGFLNADNMRQTFSLLRSNDLIWSFVVNNYLMGKEPFAFDLLFWNDDATNMPAAMHSFYIKNCYRDNQLVEKNAVTMQGTPIDLSLIKTPCYFLSTKEDHIAPWLATYAATQIFKGENHFTLAASGHVAGVINPPAKNKYCYWSSDKIEKTAEKWLENASLNEGSWWPHWQGWIEKFTLGEIDARSTQSQSHPAIEEAPGSYVKMKAED